MKEIKMDSFSSPESSNIESATYNLDTKELTITFKGRETKRNGAAQSRTYTYPDVPQSVWEEFKSSSSKGKYATQNIIGAYRGSFAQ